MTAGDVQAVLEESARAKQRFGLPEDARVVSGDEAGQDGFWSHRFVVAQGIENCVVDSSSLEVNRRQRRAKTDRLDVQSSLEVNRRQRRAKTDRLDVQRWLTMLLRYVAGEKKGWSVVRVPRVADEDRRQLHRELLTAKRDRTRVTNRLQGRLAGYGGRFDLQGDVRALRGQMQPWDGAPLPPARRARLAREWLKVCCLTEQIAALEAERRQRLRTSQEPVGERIRPLTTRRGIGTNSAWLSGMAFFAWREFRHRQQVGAWAGLTPTPHQRGQSRHELGLTKAGHRHIRALAIEMAWGWWRFQPESARSRWDQARVGQGGCPGPEDRHGGAGPEVVDRALAVLRDGGSPAGSVAQGGGADTMSRRVGEPHGSLGCPRRE